MSIKPLSVKFNLLLSLASKRRSPLIPTSPFTLNWSVLEFVKTYRYLGVTFDSQLTWVDHIKAIVIKYKKLVWQIYRQFYDCSDTAILWHAPLHLSKSDLIWNIFAWDSNTQYLIEMLESVQRFTCIRLSQNNVIMIIIYLCQFSIYLHALSVQWMVSKFLLFYKIVSLRLFIRLFFL